MEPIYRNNRKFEDVMLRIRDELISDNYRPGDKLPSERDLAEILKVSRTSVREALRIMEFLDVVQSKPGEGTIVKTPEMAIVLSNLQSFLFPSTAVSELFEVRRVLEGSIAMLAAERRSEADIKEMTQALEMMAIDDLDVQLKADMDFHNVMTNAAGNKTLSDILLILSEIFSKNMKNSRVLLFRVESAREDLYDLHKVILDAIIEQDGDAAKRGIEASLYYAYHGIQKLSNIISSSSERPHELSED